jgi:Mg-chelatase subunit ChlD
MKAKTVGILVVGTFLLSTCASMTLAAKDLDSNPAPSDRVEHDKAQSKERPKMDLAFCIDTTGSMQGEIDMVKTKVKDLVAKLSSGKPAPIVRVGLVAFRDRGDTYVTKVYPFSEDIDKFVGDISQLQADGGGDGPEALNEALHASVNELAWDQSNKTAKLLFLIGDAGPHFYPNDYKWEDEAKNAIAKGIQINTLACDGLQSTGDGGMEVFQQIAKLSDGQFENLAYRQIVRDESGREKTVISSGGAAYEVAESAASDWKTGAKALSAAGKAKPVMALPVVAARSAGGYRSVRASMAPMMAGATSGTIGSSEAFAEGAASAGAPAGFVSVNRKDSNLDSLMYDAAMKKARAKLNVSY